MINLLPILNLAVSDMSEVNDGQHSEDDGILLLTLRVPGCQDVEA